MLMPLMSIERHFPVFRPQLYRLSPSRYILHYFPIIIIIFRSSIYSLVTDVFLTCLQIRFRYTRILCGYTCLFFYPFDMLFREKNYNVYNGVLQEKGLYK